MIARLRTQGEPIAYAVVADADGTAAGGWTAGALPAADGVSSVARRTVARARAAGLAARATADANGALAVVVHLDERSFLAPPRTDWLHALGLDGSRRAGLLVEVAAPDGTVVYATGAPSCADCAADHAGDLPGTDLPPELSGPTVLDVDVTSRLPALPEARIHVDCAAAGFLTADRARACASVVRDRYALMTPPATDGPCADPGIANVRVVVRGTLGGVPVRRDYGADGCTAETATRWVRTLNAARVLPAAWQELGSTP